MISMHAGQPGTRRRQMAKQTGGVAHSTVVEYEGDENDVAQAIRCAEQPKSNAMAIFTRPKMQFGMVSGARNRQHAKLREVAPSAVVEEHATTVSLEAQQEDRLLTRRMNSNGSKEQWTQRGMFKLGFNSGSPRVRSARKFTK